MTRSVHNGPVIDGSWYSTIYDGARDDAIRDHLDASTEGQLQRLYREVQQGLRPALEFIIERGRHEYETLVRLTEEIREGADAPAGNERIPAPALEMATAIATLPVARMAVIELFLALPEDGVVLRAEEWAERAIRRAGIDHMARMAGLDEAEVPELVIRSAAILCGSPLLSEGLSLYFNERLMTVIGKGGKVEVERARATVVQPNVPVTVSGGPSAASGAGLLLVTPADSHFTLSFCAHGWFRRFRAFDARISTNREAGWIVEGPSGLRMRERERGDDLGPVSFEVRRAVVMDLSDDDKPIASFINVEPVF